MDAKTCSNCGSKSLTPSKQFPGTKRCTACSADRQGTHPEWMQVFHDRRGGN